MYIENLWEVKFVVFNGTVPHCGLCLDGVHINHIHRHWNGSVILMKWSSLWWLWDKVPFLTYRKVLFDASYLLEASPNGSASCHKIAAPHKIEAPGAFDKILMESMHKYIVLAGDMLLNITMAATTTCLLVRACRNYHASVTHYKRPYDAKMARNRSALGIVLAPGASNRDNTVI